MLKVSWQALEGIGATASKFEFEAAIRIAEF
jgi:hypothetical protein